MIRRWLAQVAAVAGSLPAALWILRHERLICSGGRPLRARELEVARHLGIADPGAVRILEVPRVPSPLGGLLAPLEKKFGFSLGLAAGVTLGYGIYAAQDHASPGLVAHELVHVRQYETHGGPLPFIHQYFYECLVLGYQSAPLEVEARRLSREWQ